MNAKKKRATQTAKQRLDKVAQSRLELREVAKDLAQREWLPLVSWPGRPHTEQSRLDGYRAIPSRLPKRYPY